MAITSRQFDQLNEMGISLWQHKTTPQSEETENNHYISLNATSLSDLNKLNIFSDILHCLNLSAGEVSTQKDHLDVGLFNWYFTDDSYNSSEQAKNSTLISFTDNKLISPSIEAIAKSTPLKRQLWHTIANHLI